MDEDELYDSLLSVWLDGVAAKVKKFAKFILVALLMFAATMITMWLLLPYLHPLWINTINFFGWGLVKFIISDRWVFKDGTKK